MVTYKLQNKRYAKKTCDFNDTCLCNAGKTLDIAVAERVINLTIARIVEKFPPKLCKNYRNSNKHIYFN